MSARRSALRTAALAAALAAACSSAPPVDLGDDELARHGDRARAEYHEGRVASAARSFERALRRARRMDDPLAIGNAAYNAGVCFLELGRLDEADARLAEAQFELDRAGEALADVLLVRAKAARARGDVERAAAIAASVLEHPRAAPDARHRAEVLALRGELAVAAGDLSGARRWLSEASAESAALGERATEANVAALRARVRGLEGDPLAAAESFDEEADLARDLGRHPRMVDALERAGDAWARAGGWSEATDRWCRAARSRWAAGESAAALRACHRALECAERCEDQDVVSRAVAVAHEVRAALGASTPSE